MFVTIAMPVGFAYAADALNRTTTTQTGTDIGITNTSNSPAASQTIQQIVANYIIKGGNYAVKFLIGLTVLVFMYGLMKYMFKGSDSEAARSDGRKLMIWGLVGIFVMVSVWGLVGILSTTIGHQKTTIPQFPTEKELAPNGRKADGTPWTDEETENFREGVRKTGNFFQRLWGGGRRIVENGIENGTENVNNIRERLQNFWGRLRSNQQSTPDPYETL